MTDDKPEVPVATKETMQELFEMQARVETLKTIHVYDGYASCKGDGLSWPCKTARVMGWV